MCSDPRKFVGLLLVGGLLMACAAPAQIAPAPTSAPASNAAPASNSTPASDAAPAATAAPAAANAPASATSAPAAADSRADWPSQLTLGLFGGDDSEATLNQNQPITDYISQKIGIPVKMFTGTSYSAVIEAMAAKRVDAMTVGPFSYILAAQEAGAEALAIGVSTQQDPGVYDPSIRAAYFSVISVKKGSGINSIADLKGHSFNYVDPASTSGHLIPMADLIGLGINPDTDLKTVFAGSHPTSVLSLWNDKADAAASTETTLYQLAKNNQIDFCGFPDGEVGKDRTPEEIQALFDSCPNGKIAMLHYSAPIPNTPFAIRGDLPPSLKAAVKDALLSMKDDPSFVATSKRWFLDPSPEVGLSSLDAYYNPLRDIAKTLNLDLTQVD